MIQGKDKGFWNKGIPFSIVSTTRSELRIKIDSKKEKQKGG